MSSLNEMASVIQVAVAPVFLLAGIAGFLNVMSGRLGRIIDRARVIERRVAQLSSPEQSEHAGRELKILWRRVTITNWSIGLCTAAGLLVCTLIVALFIGGFWKLGIGVFIIVCFVMAMLLLIAALLLFLKEVQLATHTLRAGGESQIE